MKYIADFHVHSKYSRATSPEMSPEGIWRWSQLKGIKVVGTGDFTHPGWLAELREKLEPEAKGLFALKKKFRSNALPGY
jgi:DNA helicase-2/ATP-dependent DNA helicase PcrA